MSPLLQRGAERVGAEAAQLLFLISGFRMPGAANSRKATIAENL
jgi:hypothetical protein